MSIEFLSRSLQTLVRSALASACCLVSLAQTSVLTQHNDLARTGQNLSETILTPANVSSGSFGKVFSLAVDGVVAAQPLYVPNLKVNGALHNVVFIATEHDSVFAFDADLGGTPLWQASLLDTAHGAAAGATSDSSSNSGCYTVNGEYGITGTPVIDSTTGTLYVVSDTYENNYPLQRLHALDITTGAEKFGGPTVINASTAGTGNGSSNGILNFDPKWELQRPGLLLVNGTVYVGFAGHCDLSNYHGWFLAYSAATLAQTSVFLASPNGTDSGIWMGAGAPAVDVENNATRIFITTGNGTFDATAPYLTNSMDYGDSILRIDGSNGIKVEDVFAPSNQATLSTTDKDLGATNPLILPDQAGAHPHLLFEGSKGGVLFLLDRDSLGEYSTTTNQVVQEIDGQAGSSYGSPAYWNGNVYLWPAVDHLKQFSLTNGLLSSTPVAVSSQVTTVAFGVGSSPSISANGNTNPIVWTVDSSQTPQVLYAHDATNVANNLWNSAANSTQNSAGNPVKFAVPTVVNGKVYVGSVGSVMVYGLPTGSPATMTATPGSTPQSATIGSAFANPLSVIVKDGSGNPVVGTNVVFTAPSSAPSGTFSNNTTTITVPTDSTGTAAASFTTVATLIAGSYHVTAVAGNLTVTFALTNVSSPAQLSAYTAGTQTGVTSRTLPLPFILARQAPVAGVNITFTVVPSSGGAGGTFVGGGTSVVVATDAQGSATSPQLTANSTPGTFAVNASDGTNTATFNVTTVACVSNPIVSGTGDSATDSTTLRYAVTSACAGSTIKFASGLGPKITLASRLRIDDSLTIQGPGAASLAIDGGGSSRLFFIGGGTVSISGLTLQNGLGQGGGGYNGGGGAGMGGAIFQNNGNLTVSNVVFSNNAAQGGSGIYLQSGEGGGGFGASSTMAGAAGGDLFGIGGGALYPHFGDNGGPGAGGFGGDNLNGVGGNGGFGGGGGNYGGAGGFGAGGGAAPFVAYGYPLRNGGFAGGEGAGGNQGSGGGGGAGLGGAIFEYAGTLSLVNDTFKNNSAVGGTGGYQNGQGKGGALFIYSGATASSSGSVFSGSVAADAGSPSVGTSPSPYAFGATCPGQDTADLCGSVTVNAVQVTIASSPSGLTFSSSGTGCAAGSTYTTPQTLTWIPGSACTVSFSTPQAGPSGTRYAFTQWEDSSTNPARAITAPASVTATYTATFASQYLLTTAVNPAGSGSVTGGGSYYTAGTAAPVVATPAANYFFSNWTGSVASASSASTTVTMSAPETVTANFGTNVSSTASATFLPVNTTTKGTWTGTYGADGYIIANDANTPPPYAIVSLTGDATWTWATPTSDTRALQTASGASTRIASTFYSTGNSFNINVNLTDGKAHRVAFYLLDWDTTSRAQTISILNASTNAVLDTESFSNFSNGEYAVWSLTGNVIIQVTRTNGINAAVAGIFFDTAPVSTAPVISAVTATNITNTSAVITWTTDQASTSLVNYGTTTSYGSSSTPSSTPVTSHIVTLSGLTPGATYDYEVVSANANGSTTSVNYTFVTPSSTVTSSATYLTLDTTTQGTWTGVYGADGYIIANDANSAPTYASVSFTGQSAWTWITPTSDPRALQIASGSSTRIASTYYGAGSFSMNVNLSDGNTHKIALYLLDWDGGSRAETISILDAGSHAVLSTQSFSNFQNGQYASWNVKGNVIIQVTLTGGENSVVAGIFFGGTVATAAPVITNVTATSITSNAATISWTTDQPSTSLVNYGASTAYGSSSNQGSTLAMSHSITLTGLTPGTTYNYDVVSANSANASTTSGNFTFATPATPPPVVSAVGIVVTTTTATIVWTTDQASTTQVKYGPTTAYGSSSPLITMYTTSHAVTLTALTPGTSYYCEIISTNSSNVTTTYTNCNFTTQSSGGGSSASYVGLDTTTQGTWTPNYGADGFVIANDETSIISYATVTFTGTNTWTWANNTSDPRALQVFSGSSGRIASTYYAPTSFTINVNITDSNTHKVALYLLDWDSGNRAETISILDATTQAVLNTQTFANFQNGQWASWDIKGSVTIKVTLTGGENAVVAGIFFGGAVSSGAPMISSVAASSITSTSALITWTTDQASSSLVNYGASIAYGSSSTLNSTLVTNHSVMLSGLTPGVTYDYEVVSANASSTSSTSANFTFATLTSGTPTSSAAYIGADTATQGTWTSTYGADGYIIANDTANSPAYAAVSLTGQSAWTWATPTSDPRALQIASGSSTRIASTYYAASSFSINVNLIDGNTHRIALYLLDWDAGSRAETISILDASTHAVLSTQTFSGFKNGEYASWNVKGNVIIQVTLTGGENAVVAGIFFR